MERLGLNPDKYKYKVQKFHLSLDSVLQKSNFLQNEVLKSFYQSIVDDIIKNSKDEFNCLKAYFKQKGFCGDIAVMDIGWNGSMQRYLVEIMNTLKVDVCMDGYYFGMRNEINNTQVHGYFYEPSRMHMEPEVSFMQGLFESLFLSSEGSTKRYRVINGVATPVLYAPEYQEKDVEFKVFRIIQDEAVRFCKEYAISPTSKLTEYKASEYSFNLVRFCTNPTLEEVSLFGDFRFYDTNVIPLARPQSLLYYVICPRKFLREFSCSAWKAGFLKRCFKVSLPYMKLYAIAKELSKKD